MVSSQGYVGAHFQLDRAEKRAATSDRVEFRVLSLPFIAALGLHFFRAAQGEFHVLLLFDGQSDSHTR
jgi:hypothetical protein